MPTQTMDINEAETVTAEQIAALIADAPAESPAAFVPTDAIGVDWVLKKIADRRTCAARIRENAEKMARAEERDAEALEWKYGAALQTWLRAELAGGKTKSKRLFHGVLGYRTSPIRLKIAPGQDTAAVAWAKVRSPEAVSERVDMTALKERLQINDAGQAIDPLTGECLDWVNVTPAEETFYIK